METTAFGYPDHEIDPKKKDYNWILAYVKAAFADNRGYVPQMPINSGQSRMQEIKEYAIGKISIAKYQKELLPTDQQDQTWMAVDWTPLGLLPKFRQIAIARILQQEFDIQAFAVDALSKSEEDAYFSTQKVKLMMRDAVTQAGGNPDEFPELRIGQGEPKDMEELKKQLDFGYKHIMSMEAENADMLVAQNSNISELEKRTVEHLYDFGLGGYKNYIDENGMVWDEEINPENLVLSYCSKNDFSDLTHGGIIREVFVGDLAPYFTKDQLNKIITQVAGKFGNPALFTYGTDLSTYWNRFKVLVLDFQFLSWNTTYYESEIDKRGNPRFRKTQFKNLRVDENGILEAENDEPLTETGDKGNVEPKFRHIKRKVVYKTKWLIKTDFMYDYGLSENQIRKGRNWWDTHLDMYLYSWNFYKMQFMGITERLMPLEDQANLIWFKLQNTRNRILPYLISLDLNSLEGVSFGKGGKNWTPDEIIDFVFSTFVVPYRSTDLLSKNPNFKPVQIENTGQLQIIDRLWADLLNTVEMMRQVAGLNEITDGSTPNSKNLTATTEAANFSTNNALWLIQNARKQLRVKLADANIAKVQIAVKLGKVSGYTKALGSETVKFLQINPNISNHEFGIFYQDVPTQAQKELFWQTLNAKEYQGFIEPQDKIFVMSCRNLKQAEIELAYRIKKRKEEAQAYELQKMQEQANANTQTAMQLEQMKQQSSIVMLQAQIELENVKGQWQYTIEMMKKQNDANEAQIQSQAKVVSSQITADAKERAAHIAANSHLVGTDTKVTGDLIMTEMDNNTKKQTEKKKTA